MEVARLFEARVLQTGSLSNPTLTWGPIYPLRFHKTKLEDLCALFKKKNFCHYCVQIREILVASFSDLVPAEMFEPVFGLEYHLLSFMNSILTFQKKKKKTPVIIGFKYEKSWFLPLRT